MGEARTVYLGFPKHFKLSQWLVPDSWDDFRNSCLFPQLPMRTLLPFPQASAPTSAILCAFLLELCEALPVTASSAEA